MKRLKIHVGNVTTFLKLDHGWGNGFGRGYAYGARYKFSCGIYYNCFDGDGFGDGFGYYKTKNKVLVEEENDDEIT